MEKKRKQSGDKFMRSADSEREFKQEVIDLARVTRVMAGGKRMRFRLSTRPYRILFRKNTDQQ